jgi:hypothetical protein
MTPERWRRVREVAVSTWERDAAERSGFLDQACSGDAQLRAEVEAILRSDEQATGFLEAPVADLWEGACGAFARALLFKPGDLLGPYQIVDLIDAGGMGEVYRARDTRLNRTIAVKVLAPGLSADPASRERFEREALAVSSLNHPNICVLHDIGRQGEVSYLVMEYLEGESLAARLRKGSLSLEQTLRYAIEIADALDAAHAQGIVHRDLKPGNIILTDRDQVKLLDFGLAMQTGASTGQVPPERPALTMPGFIMGTVAYMSPEQASGETLDARTDLFSFGSVLYEMATGSAAFPGNNSAALAAILTQPPRDPATLNKSLPIELQHVISRLLMKDREKRFQSAGAVRAALRAIQPPVGLPPAIEPAPSTVRTVWSRKFGFLTGICLFGIAAVSAGVLYLARPPILTARDSIVLGDFTNTTGDPVFDGTLRQALWLKLSESPFLSVLSDEQMTRTLRLMRRQTGAPVTPELAREICQRNGLKAIVSGSISPVGRSYFLQLTATNCIDGESLARSGLEVGGKEVVLKGLSKAAIDLRSKLGESLKSVHKYDKPFEATSSSLDALRAYSLAKNSRMNGKLPDQLAWLERAIELDPKFAYAYASLSAEYWNRKQRRSPPSTAGKRSSCATRLPIGRSFTCWTSTTVT